MGNSDMDAVESQGTTEYDYDVVIIGGGPAGCSAGVFVGRDGLDTVIFDRRRSSIQRCAHPGNYLGFPAGIDTETFYGLLHGHAEEASCEILSDLVETVESTHVGFGSCIEIQEIKQVTAGYVVATTRYDGEYLRSLNGEEMFESDEHDGEIHEHFDRLYADTDGETVTDGLYVVSPSTEADRQAIIAIGQGEHVELAHIKDVRQERGYPATVADHYDWVRRETELDDERRTRDRWREWLADRIPDDHDVDEERRVSLHERETDRRFEDPSTDETDRRAERGHDRLLEHIDDNRVLERAREGKAGRRSAEVGE